MNGLFPPPDPPNGLPSPPPDPPNGLPSPADGRPYAPPVGATPSLRPDGGGGGTFTTSLGSFGGGGTLTLWPADGNPIPGGGGIAEAPPDGSAEGGAPQRPRLPPGSSDIKEHARETRLRSRCQRSIAGRAERSGQAGHGRRRSSGNRSVVRFIKKVGRPRACVLKAFGTC